jgi:hypothetical protein
MEMVSQPCAVVLIRVAYQEGIDIKPAFRVPRKAIPQLFRYIEGIVIGIVRRGTDIHIDEDPAAALELDQGHIAVADREKCQFGNHTITPSAAGSCGFGAPAVPG